MASILNQLGDYFGTIIGNVYLNFTKSDSTFLASAKSYTDQKITDLVNGAPETLDTLKEIADEIESNETALDAITDAVQNHTHPVATETTNGFMAAADKKNLDSTLTNVETIQEDLTANTATLASHTSTLASHTSTLASHTSTIASLKTEDENLASRIDTNDEDIEALLTNQTADEATLASHTSTLSSHTSSIASHTATLTSLSSSKLSTSQLYAGIGNLITKPGIDYIVSALTSSSYVQPKNTTQGAYAVSWTFTGPSDTYDSSSSASSGTVQFLTKTFNDATTSYYPILSRSTLASSGFCARYLWVSFYVDGWTKSSPPVNLIQLGGSSSNSWFWSWDSSSNTYCYKSGYIQVSDTTRRYFWGFSTGSYSSLYLFRVALACQAYYPNTHAETVTIYRPMVSIGTCLADWAPSPIDQFC